MQGASGRTGTCRQQVGQALGEVELRRKGRGHGRGCEGCVKDNGWGWAAEGQEERLGPGLTGEHCDIVLVGLVEGVVDDALLVREALEDVHAHLGGGTSLEPGLGHPQSPGGWRTPPWT